MKFLHISDLHIGKRVNEFSMIEDQKYILRQIKEIALEKQVDAVMIAGDIYDKPVPSLSARIILIYFRHFANNMPISTLKTGGLDLKKIKRILAILGAIILAGLYISTIVCALSSNENYMDMLMASVYATVIIPVLIWAYSFVYKMVKKNHEQKED